MYNIPLFDRKINTFYFYKKIFFYFLVKNNKKIVKKWLIIYVKPVKMPL